MKNKYNINHNSWGIGTSLVQKIYMNGSHVSVAIDKDNKIDSRTPGLFKTEFHGYAMIALSP